jgi:aryl-alcohol dehydrogenase-like predicted oxidoreductase
MFHAPTRRALLTGMGAAVSTLAVPSSLNADGGRQSMHKRRIPSSGEHMPIVGFGTWQTFDIGEDRAALDQRKEVLEELFAAGGSVIDSSPMYGRAETAVGRLLNEMGARDKAFLATKVWTSGRAAGIAQMSESFAKMQTATMDLMQIHNLVDWRTHLVTLRAWKDEKRIRYIGLTHYTDPALDQLADIIRHERVDFLQFGYSVDSRAAERRLLPLAAERGVAVIINQPFGSGSLFSRARGKPLPDWAGELDCASWAQFFLKFILGHPAVTCVIPGTAKPQHAKDNVAAGMGRLPDEAQRRRMAAYWDAL